MKSLKFCKRQTRRLFDILLCIEAAKSGNMAYQECMATIKDRMKADMEVTPFTTFSFTFYIFFSSDISEEVRE